jgi:hypothetical protein
MEQSTVPHEKATLRATAGKSFAETVISGAVVVVAILGLAGLFPGVLLAVATIGIGAAFLMQGGAISARIKRILRENFGENSTVADVGSGVSAEVVGGLIGIVLGILALAGVMPATLVAIASLTYGGALILSSDAMARINNQVVEMGARSEAAKRLAHEALSVSSGVQLLVGLGAITLGILALIGINPAVLLLVSMLGLSAADLLSGTALGGRMMAVLER